LNINNHYVKQLINELILNEWIGYTISKLGDGIIKMIKISSVILVFLFFNLDVIHAQPLKEVSYPCSVILKPVKDIPNAKGTGLITKVKKPYSTAPTSPVRERKGVGIYADWLPSPSSFGDYDQYEGFVQIMGEISW
jgi:hypothetical protein